MDGGEEQRIIHGQGQIVVFIHIVGIHAVHAGEHTVDGAGAGRRQFHSNGVLAVDLRMLGLPVPQQLHKLRVGKGFAAVGALLADHLAHVVIAADEAVDGVGIIAVPVGQVVVVAVIVAGLVQRFAVHGLHIGHQVHVVAQVDQRAGLNVLLHDVGGAIH